MFPKPTSALVVEHDARSRHTVVTVALVGGQRDRVLGVRVPSGAVDRQEGCRRRQGRTPGSPVRMLEHGVLVGDPDLAPVVGHEARAAHGEVRAGGREGDAVLPLLERPELPGDRVGAGRHGGRGGRRQGELGVGIDAEDDVAVRADGQAIAAPAVGRQPRRSGSRHDGGARGDRDRAAYSGSSPPSPIDRK